jgi:hypothetical protein
MTFDRTQGPRSLQPLGLRNRRYNKISPALRHRAASEALVVERGLAGVRAWKAENGELTDAELADAGERNERALWAIRKRALARNVRPTVPAGVLAQGWRGGPQVNLSRLLGHRINLRAV